MSTLFSQGLPSQRFVSFHHVFNYYYCYYQVSLHIPLKSQLSKNNGLIAKIIMKNGLTKNGGFKCIY